MVIVARKSENNKLRKIYPKTVVDFNCAHLELTTLVNSPQKIIETFNCNNNYLLDLAGGPAYAARYNCEDNRLTSLFGAPKKVSSFWCSHNPNLIDVSYIWDSDIEDVFIEINAGMALLPLVKFQICDVKNSIFKPILMKKHKGSSKQNIIDFQYDLIENGFSEYAKWRP